MDFPETYKRVVAVKHVKDFRAACEIQEVPFPTPGPKEIVIRNRFAGANASDLMMAAGQYLLPTPLPCPMGAEAVGEVVLVGDEVEGIKVGDSVLVNAIGAGYTEYFVSKAKPAVPIPAATPEIMSLSIGGLTASVALEETGEMTTGETVLVTAAAGGTGQFAVQLAKLAGNHVIGTCSTQEKADLLRSLGCDRVVNYKEENLHTVLKEEYPRGVDIVFEGVGTAMFDTALRHLARYGRLITIGFISEYKEEPDTITDVRVYYKILGKMASIRGFNLNLYFGKPVLAEHMMKLVSLLNEGKLQVSLDPTPFKGVEAAIDAVEHLHAGKNSGKVIVTY